MKIIFVDRDGVINQYPGDGKYVTDWSEFHFLPRIKAALKRLNDNDFKIFVISNQAGVSKGIYTQKVLSLITDNMLNELTESGVFIEDVFYCTHRDIDCCPCRKPKTGLIDKAVSKLKKQGQGINLRDSYFIGDTIRDIETGKSAGLKTILVFSGKEKPENRNNWPILPEETASNLSEAVDLVLKK